MDLSEGLLAGKSRSSRYRMIKKIKMMDQDNLKMNNQRLAVVEYVQKINIWVLN